MKKSISILTTMAVTILTLVFASQTYIVDSAINTDNGCCTTESSCTLTPDFLPANEEDELADDEERMSEELNTTQQIITVEGIYTGQIDSNSIEVKVNDQPMAFFLSELVRPEFTSQAPQTNMLVKLEYYRNEKGQNILNSIQVIKK